MTVAPNAGKVDQDVSEIIDDASLTAVVKVVLQSHRCTCSASTTIGSHDGIVTISGDAQSPIQKDQVTRLSEDISGVRRVDNKMLIVTAPWLPIVAHKASTDSGK